MPSDRKSQRKERSTTGKMKALMGVVKCKPFIAKPMTKFTDEWTFYPRQGTRITNLFSKPFKSEDFKQELKQENKMSFNYILN